MTTNNELDKYKRALEAGVPLEELRRAYVAGDDSYDALRNQQLYGSKIVKPEMNWDSEGVVVPIPGAGAHVTLPNRVWVTPPPHAGGSIPPPTYRSPPTMPEWVEQLREVNRKNFELTMQNNQLLQLVADAYELFVGMQDGNTSPTEIADWLKRIDNEGT